MEWNGIEQNGFVMEYKIKNLCNELGFGVSKFYNLKEILDNSIPEQNRMEYYYNKGRNFYITEKGFNWFKDNSSSKPKNETKTKSHSNTNDIVVYQNQIIEFYKQRIEYLETENKRLLDIISFKEQKEVAKDIKHIGNKESLSFWDKFFNIFRK